jgi:hypothetical protein
MVPPRARKETLGAAGHVCSTLRRRRPLTREGALLGHGSRRRVCHGAVAVEISSLLLLFSS